jgi:hypothetical protein
MRHVRFAQARTAYLSCRLFFRHPGVNLGKSRAFLSAGIDNLKKEVVDIVAMLKNPQKWLNRGIKIPSKSPFAPS